MILKFSKASSTLSVPVCDFLERFVNILSVFSTISPYRKNNCRSETGDDNVFLKSSFGVLEDVVHFKFEFFYLVH